MKRIMMAVAGALCLWACAKKMAPAKSETAAVATTPTPVTPAPVPAPAPAPGGGGRINTALIANGKKVYEASCGRCHALKAPVDYTQQSWVPIIDRMAIKARLDEIAKAQVLAYAQHYAKDAPADKSGM